MKKTLLIIFIFIFGSKISYSQSHVYKHYGIEDGLPSSEVYSAFQDSKGYMWFATDAGVSRFNGYEFENFDVSDGLTDNTVFLITEDSKGRVWFGTFNCQLSYYFNDSIYPYQHNNKIAEKMKGNLSLQSFYVDSNENIWMGFLSDGIFKCDKEGKITQLVNLPKNKVSLLKGFKVENTTIWGQKSIYLKKKELIDKFVIHIDENTTGINFGADDYDRAGSQFIRYDNDVLIVLSNDLLLLKKNGDRLKINEEGLIPTKNGILNIMTCDSFLFIPIRNSSVYKCIIKGGRLIVVDRFFKNSTISRVFKDNAGGFWFQTLKEGVYYLSSENIVSKSFNSAITALEVDTVNQSTYLGFNNGDVQVRRREQLIFKTIANINDRIFSLKQNYETGSIIVSGPKYSMEISKEGVIPTPYLKSKDLLIDGNIIYGIGGGSLFFGTNERLSYYSADLGEPPIWGTSLLKIGEDIWIGSKAGIRVYKNNKISNPFHSDKDLSSYITCMARLNDSIVLTGTKSKGLLLVKNNSVIDRISEKNGLIQNLIKSIHVDNEKTIWIGTSKGLSKLNYRGENDFDVYNIKKIHGLISEEVIAINSYRSTIYAATPKGLIQFDKTKVRGNSTHPPVYITEFNVNSEEREIKENTGLTYKENFIKIYFEGLNYRSLGKVEYQYRMLGVDTNWTKITSRSVQYPTLQPNEYQFEVKAKNEDGYWSDPTRLSFSISPPFWLTWWFISLEILFGIGIIVAIFLYREKQLSQKNDAAQKIAESEKKMIELELKALRAQMNPHFIFNTLNSIQHYIATNDFKNTNKYIVQFARLIRTILHLSEKTVITIQEEIDILTMYMNLEKMRFEEQFDYFIEVDDGIDVDYDEIPSMLLQPYVENAIWHGLMNKKGKGVIKIGIKEDGDYLHCVVQDNDVNVEMIDLYDTEGSSQGTKMIIKIQREN